MNLTSCWDLSILQSVIHRFQYPKLQRKTGVRYGITWFDVFLFLLLYVLGHTTVPNLWNEHNRAAGYGRLQNILEPQKEVVVSYDSLK